MNKSEQDKNWKLLSEESKDHYKTEYKNRLKDSKREIKDPEDGWDLTVVYSQTIATDLEKIFGKHNLKPAPTYEEVAKKLFENAPTATSMIGTQIHGCDYRSDPDMYEICVTSNRQYKKLIALNMLLNVAKDLNKNEDGSVWKPSREDWANIVENDFYTIGIDPDNGEIEIVVVNKWGAVSTAIIYFRTKELAEEAVEILGEEIVRTALTIEY